jgi:transcriptional regulator with XRE-family HTH domain
MDLEKIVGENVRGFRKQQGMTQDELGKYSAIHRDFWAGIERGERNITLETLKRISTALQVEPFVLLIPGSHKWTQKGKS